ncbi:hypothetical protein F5X98DRAFT_371054 [Xylaria grammica]|nr:hypothetical protein F5X98DRAFT_371054 [Xylaria grammica]
MHQEQAHNNYADWISIQRWGRGRIDEASKDPAARAKLLAEILPPRPVLLQPQHDEIRLASRCFPAYCATTTTLNRPSPNNTHSFSFLGSFPAEVRNAIYQYVVDYPTCRELFDAYYGQVGVLGARTNSDTSRSFTVNLYTPNILLLCKQITRESLSLLRLRPFVIDRIPPWIMGNPKPLPLTHLISKTTLQNIRFVEIKLSIGDAERHFSGRVWYEVLDDVLRAWSEKNSLVRLRIMIKVNNIDVDLLWDFELRNYANIMKMIDYFAFKHGSRPNLVQYEHWVIDGNYAYKCGFEYPLIRKHPDPHIWQGSVMEWI